MDRTARTPALGLLVALIVIAGFSLTSMQTARSQVPTEPPSFPDGEVQTDRLDGTTRFETSVSISQEAFPAGAADVFLARADNFPDALSAGALTTGPILLVPSCDDVPEVVLDEITRLQPERVVAVGGQQAVCDDVLDQAAEAAAAGADPSETPTASPSPTATASPAPTTTPTECGPIPTSPGCLDPSPTPTPTETTPSA